jgi:RNA-splicing ligase RtcB
MKKNALNNEDSENIEGSDLYAVMYCGALYFARERRLIKKDVARRFFEQFRKDFESLDLDPSAREDKNK